MNKFEKIDIENKLLLGTVIWIGKIPIHKIELSVISDFGYTRFLETIQTICVDESRITGEIKDQFPDFNTYSFMIAAMLTDERIKKNVLELLSLICKTDVVLNLESYVFIVGDAELNSENFDDFRKIVKIRNLIDVNSSEEFEENPSNEKARQLLARSRELKRREKEKTAADGDGDGLTLNDLISIFASYMKIPVDDVKNKYDMYQFNNQFSRIKVYDDYITSIQALLHGAKSEDIKLTHWISKYKDIRSEF